jgi:hypothetical protein
MPWFEYVCDRCGKTVTRSSSIKHRNAAPVHGDDEGCEGRLRRAVAVPRPTAPRSSPPSVDEGAFELLPKSYDLQDLAEVLAHAWQRTARGGRSGPVRNPVSNEREARRGRGRSAWTSGAGSG